LLASEFAPFRGHAISRRKFHAIAAGCDAERAGDCSPNAMDAGDHAARMAAFWPLAKMRPGRG
jgi:hypothetical protein